jgi:serine/threonine protein kinase
MLNEPLAPGDNLRDRYVIMRVHRLSGLSALYEARDNGASEAAPRYAIKEVIVQDTEEILAYDAIKEFERVAEALLTLDHPAIPKMFEYFVENERTYLVTEFLLGKDLETIMIESADLLPVKTVCEWGIALGDVLNYLHTRDPNPIVYRDLKPPNVMLCEPDRIRLVDFGIAVIYVPSRIYPPLGTDGYAAPEQYVGDVYPLIDVYGLGATLHHLLTGSDPRLEPPFSFDKRPIRQFNPGVPEALDAIIMRAVSYNSWERFPSMSAMLDALKEAGKALE